MMGTTGREINTTPGPHTTSLVVSDITGGFEVQQVRPWEQAGWEHRPVAYI